MNKIDIRPLTADHVPAVVELQAAYTAVYPDALIIPGELYLSPAYEDGRNIFCALNETNQDLHF